MLLEAPLHISTHLNDTHCDSLPLESTKTTEGIVMDIFLIDVKMFALFQIRTIYFNRYL